MNAWGSNVRFRLSEYRQEGPETDQKGVAASDAERRRRIADLSELMEDMCYMRVLPSCLLTQPEFQVALEDALQELPEAFRTVFLLRDGEGLSYEEIAAVLSISAKTVSSRLHRARQQLRALLQEHLER